MTEFVEGWITDTHAANAEIARLRREKAALVEALNAIIRRDKRYEENCTSQDTGYDGPCAKIARAALRTETKERQS